MMAVREGDGGDVVTEAEWGAGTGPTPMLEYLKGIASEPSLRLFACT